MNDSVVLRVKSVSKSFASDRGLVRAVEDVSLSIGRGEILGLVGESGCGKSTLGKLIMRLIEPDGGEIGILGRNIVEMRDAELRAYRSRFQMIFQDPLASLNPRHTVLKTLQDALKVGKWGDAEKINARISWLLEKVGLRDDLASRFPHQLSGGQRQRVGIARALALNPDLIVCDEAVSALDVSVQAQILNLLSDLRDQLGIAFLFISHDLSTIQFLADRVAVMYLGKLVEVGNTDDVLLNPRHPYTQALMESYPDVKNIGKGTVGVHILSGEPPNPIDPPQGCRFHPRCPYARDICHSVEPELKVDDGGRSYACHFPLGLDGGSVARVPDRSAPGVAI